MIVRVKLNLGEVTYQIGTKFDEQEIEAVRSELLNSVSEAFGASITKAEKAWKAKRNGGKEKAQKGGNDRTRIGKAQ